LKKAAKEIAEKRESTVRKDTHQVANSAQAVADDPNSPGPFPVARSANE